MNLVFKKKQDKTTAICCGIDDKNYDGEVIIPPIYDGALVDSIAPSAFSKSCISSVHIPKTIKSIGMQAFAYCDNLAQVTFAEDSCLEIIDPLAFSGCDNLTYIKMPDRIRVIERLAFRNCTCEFPNRCLVMTPNFEGCKVITYEPNLPPLAPIEQDELGNKYRLNEARDGYIVETLYAKEDVIEVPEMFNGLPVVELGNMAFTWNTEAWKTIIPASVKKAGYFPFYACDEMGYAEYGGTIKEWTEMDIYTWFNVHCKDGIIEGKG